MTSIATASRKPSWWKSIVTELFRDRSTPEKQKLSGRELSNLFTMLGTLLENGMPLQKALQALSRDSSLKKQREILRRLHGKLVEGSSFHHALQLFPRAFSPMIVQQIKLGESSGNLTSAIARIVKQVESWQAIKTSLVQKLSYPGLVVTAGAGLMFFMLTTVVPQFESIYADSEVSLPWVTQVVTSASRTACDNLWLPAVPLALALAVWFQVRRSVTARRQLHAALTKVPVMGSFVRDIAVLQYLRSVHALSEAGFNPIDAVRGACTSVQNLHVQRRLTEMSRQLVSGTSISRALAQVESLIPSAVRQLISVGEHSGDITKACEGACEFLENRLKRRIGGVMGMIEPIITVGLATCIGWVVLAMYMPMFKMFDVLDF